MRVLMKLTLVIAILIISGFGQLTNPLIRTKDGAVYFDVPEGAVCLLLTSQSLAFELITLPYVYGVIYSSFFCNLRDVIIVQHLNNGSQISYPLSTLLAQAAQQTDQKIAQTKLDLQKTINDASIQSSIALGIASASTLQQANSYTDTSTANNYKTLSTMVASVSTSVSTLTAIKANKTDTYNYVDQSVANAIATANSFTNNAILIVKNTDIVNVLANVSSVNSSVIAGQVVVASINSTVAAIASCGTFDLTYSQKNSRCEPAAPPRTCASSITVGVATAACGTVTFDAKCTVACPSGYSGATVQYWCDPFGAWQPVTVVSSCSDINECATNNGGCEQVCTNLPGTFACSCPNGLLDTDSKACQKMNAQFLATPLYVKRSSSTVACSAQAVTIAGLPTDATAIIATIHTYSTSSDNVVHSFGRYSGHSCANVVDGLVYSTPAYLNDVLISHNGSPGTTWSEGHAHGSHIIPLSSAGTFQLVMNMQATIAGTHYISMTIFGYINGTLGFLGSADIFNFRLASLAINNQVPNNMLTIPIGLCAAAIASFTTFITNRNDYYVMTFGRNASHPISQLADGGMFTDLSNTYNDFFLVSAGDSGQIDYNGRSHGAHILPLKSGTNNFDIYNNINKNEAVTNTAQITAQVFGYIPLPMYSNIKILPTNQVTIIRLSSTNGNDLISNIIPVNVPTNATAILANIYSFQVNRADSCAHSFGRVNTHNNNIIGVNIFNNATSYFNDVLVTYHGKADPVYYNGYSHGSNIIPLKSNGRFDAQLGITKSSASGQHQVILQVYGYVSCLS